MFYSSKLTTNFCFSFEILLKIMVNRCTAHTVHVAQRNNRSNTFVAVVWCKMIFLRSLPVLSFSLLLLYSTEGWFSAHKKFVCPVSFMKIPYTVNWFLFFFVYIFAALDTQWVIGLWFFWIRHWNPKFQLFQSQFLRIQVWHDGGAVHLIQVSLGLNKFCLWEQNPCQIVFYLLTFSHKNIKSKGKFLQRERHLNICVTQVVGTLTFSLFSCTQYMFFVRHFQQIW